MLIVSLMITEVKRINNILMALQLSTDIRLVHLIEKYGIYQISL